MHDLKRVQKTHTHNYLLTYLSSVVLLQELVVLHEVEQVLTVHQLSYYVNVRLRLDALLELQQQRVRYNLHYAALVTTFSNMYAISIFASAYSLNVAISLSAYYRLSSTLRHRYTTENLPVPIFYPISYRCWIDSPL